MNQKELLKHIKLGENSDIEFKSAKVDFLNHFGRVYQHLQIQMVDILF